MPIFAILSDIHANYDALEVVLEKCRELGIEKYISLGDVVGYNAEPGRCLKAIQNLNCVARVIGNHDFYAVYGEVETSGFNINAQKVIAWTREQLSEDDRQWLLSSPEEDRIPFPGISVVHSTLDTPLNWGYIMDCHHARASFEYQRTAICFCGHSHVPIAFIRKPMAIAQDRVVDTMPDWNFSTEDPQFDIDFTRADSLTISYKHSGAYKYLINVGSIGQPRNGDPRASFAVLDSDKHTITRYRLPYDIAAAQSKIRAAGLPERLAARLAAGT